MWCRTCKTEFGADAGLSRCPDCGTKLIDLSSDKPLKSAWLVDFKNRLTDNWPYNESGEPEKAVFLTHCSSVDMDDKIVINMLRAYDIPVIRNHPESGGVGKVVLGMSGYGTDIYVPESMLDDAKALLEEGGDD